MDSLTIGAFCFGLVIGWITYRTLRRKEGAAALSDIATVIGAVGGGAVAGMVDGKQMFGPYSIGLAIGFFAYLIIAWLVEGSASTGTWRMRDMD
jgi:hypothetical protein